MSISTLRWFQEGSKQYTQSLGGVPGIQKVYTKGYYITFQECDPEHGEDQRFPQHLPPALRRRCPVLGTILASANPWRRSYASPCGASLLERLLTKTISYMKGNLNSTISLVMCARGSFLHLLFPLIFSHKIFFKETKKGRKEVTLRPTKVLCSVPSLTQPAPLHALSAPCFLLWLFSQGSVRRDLL